MASSIPMQVAETVQTAHIQRNPSPAHDLNPSTAASKREPVEVVAAPSDGDEMQQHGGYHHDEFGIDGDEDEDDQYDDVEEIPTREIRPKPRRRRMPPIPDLRYEQSYLHSIRGADRWWKVLLITARDQVVMPLAQGILYNLVLCGWQHWNRNARLSGSSLGVRVRRWWYRVNKWPIPAEKEKDMSLMTGHASLQPEDPQPFFETERRPKRK